MLEDLLINPEQRTLVPAAGRKNARIALIGEAPGSEEVRLGMPFVGSAGRLLNNRLEEEGMSREDCYITNVVKVQPIGNDITEFIRFKKNGAAVTTPAYDAFERQLYEELQSVEANVLVPLGNIPLYAITREHGISKWRGSTLASIAALGNRKVIPTIHPAAALRENVFNYYIRRDMKKIFKESQFPDIILPQRHLLTHPTFEQALEWLDSIVAGMTTAVDIEVSGYYLSCIGFSKSPYDVMCIPFRGKLGNYWTEYEERILMRKIGEIIANKDITKIFHNASFDLFFLYENYNIKAVNYEDTMIAMRILYTDMRKSLANCASLFTDEPFYKDEGKEDPASEYALTQDFNQFWLYNCKDVAVTHEIWLQFKIALEHYKNTQTYKDLLATVDSVIYMTVRGLKLDSGSIYKYRDALLKHIEEYDNKILAIANWRVDKILKQNDKLKPPQIDKLGSSPVQRARYFYDFLGITPYKNKLKRRTADADAMRKLAVKGYEEAALIAESSPLRKLVSSYLKLELDPDGRLRGSYDVAGTSSGRFSSSKLWRGTFWGEKRYVGVNVQTLPQLFKVYVIADDNCVLINVDLEQAEDRVVTWVGEVTKKKQAYNSGKDIHKLTASLIFGIPYESVSDVKGSSPIAGGSKSQRYWGKQSNHAFNYERGPIQFAEAYMIPVREGVAIRREYFRAYPEIASIYHAGIRASIRRNNSIVTPYGRYRRVFSFVNDELFREMFSYIPQETIARKINNDGLVPLTRERSTFYALEPLLQGHDSILLQAHLKYGIDTIKAQLTELKNRLEQPIPWKEPFVIPAGFQMGLNYSDRPETDIQKNLTGLREFKLENFEESLETLLKEATLAQAPTIAPQDIELDIEEDSIDEIEQTVEE